MNPDYFLLWKERTDRNYHFRKFPNRDSLNDFMGALDPTNLEEIKILSGFVLEERSCG
jgi:hypothetical protein